jgi:glycosyltransferase involved in cell wall biosynthesis
VRDEPVRILVLLCTHQGARFLDAQLSSIVTQTTPCQSLEIHDWGSRDDTRRILEQFQRGNGDDIDIRITIHDEAPGPARSFLTALCDTLRTRNDFDYLMFCDQDDLWSPHKLELFRSVIVQKAFPDLVYSDVSMIDALDQPLSPTMLGRPIDLRHPATLVLNLIPGMAMAVSRQFLDRCASLWSLPGWLMHDFAICIAVYLTAARTHFISTSLTAYRQHAGGFTRAANGVHSAVRPFEMLWRARRYVHGVYSQFTGPVRMAAHTLGVDSLPAVLDRKTVDRMIVSSGALSPNKAIPYRLAFFLFTPLPWHKSPVGHLPSAARPARDQLPS